MNHGDPQDMEFSLSETCSHGFDLSSPVESLSIGNGCLLQIYPATSNSEVIRLNRERTLIGRESSCDIPVDESSVSRVHAAIDADQSGYYLQDLGSTNGTFVDDEFAKDRIRLKGGELIRLGNTIFKFMSSMDEEAHYHAVVHELMTKDSLTSAFNRSYFIPLIEKELTACREQGFCLSLILMDIDHFKQVNDTHGHLVGDEVLRIFSERIRLDLRKGDLLARFGGEEFVLAARRAPLKEAVRIAERARLLIASDPFFTQAGPVPITCSFGVASSNGNNHKTVDSLLSAADSELYKAKGNGRNCVRSVSEQETHHLI